MYRKQRRIPTLLALFILFGGLVAATYLDRFSQKGTSLASTPAVAEDVHFTNVSENSFTVSFLTSVPTSTFVIVSNTSKKLTHLDDLDSDNIPRTRKAHFITVKKLIENTTYSVKIVTGDKKCKEEQFCPTFTQTTAGKLTGSLTLAPAHGSVMKDKNTPADGAIVYLIAGKSASLSGRADSSGLWVIPLTNLRTSGLEGHADLKDEDVVQLTVKYSPVETASAVVDIKSIKQNLTIPSLILGNSYNFINLIYKKSELAKITNNQILGSQTSAVTTTNSSQNKNTLQSIDILFPKEDSDTTSDTRPRFRGIAKPNSQLLITLNSTPQTGKITVEKDGSWNWRPPKILSPGLHHLSIEGYDQNGNLITLTRSFYVLKSGERVLGEATASASLTPTEIPSPTAIPTPTSGVTIPSPTLIVSIVPTATSTPSPTIAPTITPPTSEPPRSGFIQPVTFVITGGISLFLAGVAILLLP